MRLTKTPEMEKIRKEKDPKLRITNEKGYEVIEGSPSDAYEKLEEYRHLRKEQSDFAESLEM